MTATLIPDNGVFTGYAALFDEVDLGRDVVEPGAFAASLARRGPGGVRMLFQHDPAQRIGVWEELREDARGLFVRGRIDTASPHAREVLRLIREGEIDGLSIGFKTLRARSENGGWVRRLLKVDLLEISVGRVPMQHGARIHRAHEVAL